MSNQVAYISTFLPQKCGIATYAYHLRQNVQKAKRDSLSDTVVVIKDPSIHYTDDNFFHWSIRKDNREDYIRAAEELNQSDVAVISLQHEFGIFGGKAGNYVLDFVRHLKKPLVTTFHTVFKNPKEPYAPVQRELAERSDHLVVMNHKAIQYLTKSFMIPKNKISFIPHGTPIPDMKGREHFRTSVGWQNRSVLMTFGFISRNKGIEKVIEALPEVVKRVPNALYVIAGQTHPNVRKIEGESYRNSLKALVNKLGMQNHVLMIDEFMSDHDLVRYITACDLYITPYPGLDQITSGTLAYAVGLGRPVLTTPYRYAQDLLKGFEELFVDYADPKDWSDKISALLKNHSLWESYQDKISRIGHKMSWPQVGRQYQQLFSDVAREPRHSETEPLIQEADTSVRG